MKTFTESDKVDAHYALNDCIEFIDYVLQESLIPDWLIERAYNTMANAKNTADSIKDKPINY